MCPMSIELNTKLIHINNRKWLHVDRECQCHSVLVYRRYVCVCVCLLSLSPFHKKTSPFAQISVHTSFWASVKGQTLHFYVRLTYTIYTDCIMYNVCILLYVKIVDSTDANISRLFYELLMVLLLLLLHHQLKTLNVEEPALFLHSFVGHRQRY